MSSNAAVRTSRFMILPFIGFLACSLLLIVDPATSTDYPQIRINSDSTTEVQNEQQICINPTDANNVVTCWRDFRLGGRRVAVGTSVDGGFTWVDALMPTQFGADTDPVLTVDRQGTFYLQ